MENTYFPNVFIAILLTSLASVLIYSRYKFVTKSHCTISVIISPFISLNVQIIKKECFK